MSPADRPRRFSYRVFKVFALSLLAISAVFAGYFYRVSRQRLESELLEHGRLLGGMLASGAKTAVYSENPALVRDTLQGVLERPEVLSAAVFTLERTSVAAVAKSPALEERAGSFTAAAREILARPLLRTECAILSEKGYVDLFCPVAIRVGGGLGPGLDLENMAPTAEEPIGFIRLTLDRGPLRRELGALLSRIALLALALLPIGIVAALLLARRVTEPLERLAAAVRAFGAGGGTGTDIRAITATSTDEIGRLADAFAAMIHDRTEREREQERLAERLREAQKMEAVGTLSQGISHDFKNILSTLNGAVHLLQKGEPDNEFVLKYAAKMQVSLDRARDLIERLIVFSRTRRIEPGPVDLSALLARQAPMLNEALGEGVCLNLETPDTPVLVSGDAASLEQMLLNLAYNARDAMPESGSLYLRLETVAGAAGDGNRVARITVRDTGIGMTPETRRRLFEPFFTTKDVGGGMGLGLSIVHGIVEQHRGSIEVESEPGAGTTFRVDLPLTAEAESGQPRFSGDDGRAKG